MSAIARNAFLYFAVLIFFCFWRFNLFESHRLSPEKDGGLIQFAIIDNIHKVLELDFQNWTDRRIFYPHRETLAYTDHFYLHSIIGFPYYILTRDPLETYNFIYFAQLMIAATGYYFLARQMKAGTFAIIFSGIYFVYLPAFTDTHSQINFYGFVPWFVFFCMKFAETKKTKYIYLCGLVYVLQSLVGIYFQLFMFLITPIFLLFAAIHLHRIDKIRHLFKKEFVGPILITLLGTGGIILLVNLPYLEFKITVGTVRSLSSLIHYGSDLLDIVRYPRFPGYSGLGALIGAVLMLILSPLHKRFLWQWRL